MKFLTVASRILQHLREYLRENPNIESLVLGLSGGVDSALTCALAHDAVKGYPVKLITRSLPIESKADEVKRAAAVGYAFGHDFKEVDLGVAYGDLYSEFAPGRSQDTSTEEKIRRGNIKARLRMMYLFDLAHLNRGMVLSTDNYTELLLGFWTLHGDVGNYGMLQYLWKTEVYDLARYMVDSYASINEYGKARALQACIDAVPTDGLGITNSDLDQLGAISYEEVDRILCRYLEGNLTLQDHPVIARHLKSEFKRKDPQNIPRKNLIGD